jgi:hypothetical protein
MIKVDVGTPKEPDVQAMARGLAQDFQGSVVPGTVDVGGTSGVRLKGSASASGLEPREALVVLRDGKAFLIMAGAVPGTDVSAPLEHIRATWQW